jgi:hypothetical protein
MHPIFRKGLMTAALFFSIHFLSRAQTYCAPTFSSGCTFNNYISAVNVGGMTNSASGCTQWNYLSKVATMTAGDTISMSVTVAGWDGVNIFVDLNNDGDFTDTLENLFRQYKALTPPINYTFNITIPISTAPGNHRMRVNCGNGGSASNSTNPCVSIAYGNYHDYTLKVINNCPGDTNLTLVTKDDTTADFAWDARPGVAGYEYYIDTINQAPIGSGTFTVDTTAHISNLIKGKTYYFFIRTSCQMGMYSAWGSMNFVACLPPEAQISQTGDVILCKGDTLVLSVINYDPTLTYQWYLNNSKINGKTGADLDVFLFPGKYTFVAESVPGCTSKSSIAKVLIFDKPTTQAPISAQGHLLISGGFFSYEWFLNGIIITGANDSTHLATANGAYHVLGYDTNGCEGVLSEALQMKTVGFEELNGNADVLIYPNPVVDVLEIKIPGSMKQLVVEVLSLNGALLYMNTFNASSSNIKADLSHLPDGMYLIQLRAEEKNYFGKILKSK